MFSTNLYNVYSNSKTYTAVGTDLYDAILGIINWYPDIEDIDSIESIINGTVNEIKPEIIKAINSDIIVKKTSPLLYKPLQNVKGFSCFMDSILFPLLIIDGYFKYKFLTEDNCLKDSMQEIFLNFNKNNNTCIPLIKKMKECSNETAKKLFSGEQQDDSEFLITLMDIYDLEPTVVNHRRYLSNNKKDWIELSNYTKDEAVLEIQLTKESEPLELYQKGNLETFDEDNKPLANNRKYTYSYEVSRILKSDAIILHTQRRLFDRINKTKVKIAKTIYDDNRDIYYKLILITNHSGSMNSGHYTSFFRWNDDWYYYNDLRSDVKIVDWDTVKKNSETNSSLFIYYPVKLSN